MNHIDEKTLVQYVLADEKVEADRKRIEAHLNTCAGCVALYGQIKAYYDEVSQLQKEQAEPTEALTLRRMIVRVPPFAGSLNAIPKTLPVRFVLFVLRRPLVSTMSLAALFVGALLLLMPKKALTDTNPAYARAKDEFLVVYNRQGEELWRKHIGIGYDFESVYRNNQFVAMDNFATTVDVDRDGRNEIIAIFGWIPNPIAAKINEMVCYYSDGGERWKYEFNRTMTFGSEEFSNDYRFVEMTVADFDRNGKVDIVAVATHLPYYPCAIVRLDAQQGILEGEYWHSGVCSILFKTDLDGDGIEELIFGGANNGSNQADLLVLDLRTMNGHAPAPPAYTPLKTENGTEEYYVLLPQSDLNVAGPDKRNAVIGIRLTSDTLLEVTTMEIQGADRMHLPGVIYYFDSGLNCVRVDANDYFVNAHRKMVEEGRLKTVLNEQYYEDLRQGVRYWDGEKFVEEPTINRRYMEGMQEKVLP